MRCGSHRVHCPPSDCTVLREGRPAVLSAGRSAPLLSSRRAARKIGGAWPGWWKPPGPAAVADRMGSLVTGQHHPVSKASGSYPKLEKAKDKALATKLGWVDATEASVRNSNEHSACVETKTRPKPPHPKKSEQGIPPQVPPP